MAEDDKQLQESTNPVGRPLKYRTVEELDRAIKRYFSQCDPHWEYKVDWTEKRNRQGQKVKDKDGQDKWVRLKLRRRTEQVHYTMAGLARALGIDRKTLLSYKGRPDFLPSIQ